MKHVVYVPTEKKKEAALALRERFTPLSLWREEELDKDIRVFSFHSNSSVRDSSQIMEELMKQELVYAAAYYEPVFRVKLRKRIHHLIRNYGIAQAVSPDGRMVEITTDGTAFSARAMHSEDVTWNWKNVDLEALLDEGAFIANIRLDGTDPSDWTAGSLDPFVNFFTKSSKTKGTR